MSAEVESVTNKYHFYVGDDVFFFEGAYVDVDTEEGVAIVYEDEGRTEMAAVVRNFIAMEVRRPEGPSALQVLHDRLWERAGVSE